MGYPAEFGCFRSDTSIINISMKNRETEKRCQKPVLQQKTTDDRWKSVKNLAVSHK